MDKLKDVLDFCKDFLTVPVPSVCGILVYKDRMSSETMYESPVTLLTFSIFFK